MAIPTYVVEVQFGASGYVDVSSYVLNVTMDRGIDRVLTDFSAGVLTVQFNNNARVFDPTNTSSPLYYGAGGYTIVQPGGKIRVSYNGSSRRFTGFIANWDFAFNEAGLDAEATVTAYDQIYRLGQINFTGGTASAVQASSDRMNTVLAAQGVASGDYAGIEGGQTLVGFDSYPAGQTILSYLQQVARSEPADFFSNASAVMVMKDRSFTPYKWVNTSRANYVAYPSTAYATGVLYPDGSSFWGLRGNLVTNTAIVTSQFGGSVYRGGTVTAALPADQFVGFEFNDNTTSFSSTLLNYGKYQNFTGKVVFSAYLRGVAGTYSASFTVYTINNRVVTTAQDFPTVTSASTAEWVRIQGTVTIPAGTPYGVQLVAGVYGGTTFTVHGEGFQIENATTVGSYFDGQYNPGVDDATTRNRVAWAGTAFASQSGYTQSVATAVANYSILTFADNNSQGASYGNGTALPFTDLQLVYGSENLANRVQVTGTNASATVNDTTGQTLYGLRVWTQYDNLTTSTTRPADIAAGLLAEFRLPEYRAQSITIPLHALTTAQQNLVLGVELRDVVRLCFQPSNTGTIIDKYYQVLGISQNINPSTDNLIFKLASLDNFPIRLDSTFLSVLDTDTLG